MWSMLESARLGKLPYSAGFFAPSGGFAVVGRYLHQPKYHPATSSRKYLELLVHDKRWLNCEPICLQKVRLRETKSHA